MPLNPYYEDELGYLRELGSEFAKANPLIAGFLAREANDPDVERLLEGFAFLTARLRQKLEDEMPELVHGLARLVWPHYLRTVPPMTIMQFQPIAGMGDAPLKLPAGMSFHAQPLEEHRCRFRLPGETTVLPLTLQDLSLDNRVSTARLSFTIAVQGRATFAMLKGGPLRIFLGGDRDPAQGRTLLTWMLRQVRRISVSGHGREIELGPDSLHPVGFAPADAVLPYPPNGFSGFRLIQEYLAFPEKFLFVDLDGLAAAGDFPATAPLTIRIEFDRPFPEQTRITDQTIRINCVPAINLYQADALPIRIESARTDYRVKPTDGNNASIHGIDSVVAFSQKRGSVTLPSFESMRHDMFGLFDQSGIFYRERLKPATVTPGIEHYVALVNPVDRPVMHDFQVMSVSLTCSDGRLAHRLGLGTIDQPSSDTLPGMKFTNITPVTQEAPPPVGNNLMWRLVSNLAGNFGTLVNAGALRTLLATYDFRAVQDPQARRRLELMLEGIESFTSSSTDGMLRGVPVRIRQILLRATESKIGGEGELFLFGSVLEALLCAYAGINSLHRFTIEGTETNVRYQWQTRSGVRSVL